VSTGQQVPIRPTSEQETHGPEHATLQHSPSAQKPEAHSLSWVQTAPRDFLPQLPFTHFCPAVQSASVLHVEKHWLVVVSQLNGAQMTAAPGTQRPVPSHTSMPSTEALEQAPGLHTVPEGCFRQAPLPSHVPSSPQVDASAVGQMLAARGGWPAGTAVHVPIEPGTLHAWHVAVHVELQQTPSTQNPLWQSEPHPQT
jgi:hypothetical protein